jgi:hypothetical protein
VYGAATGDPDFTGGGDRVRYRIPVPAGGRFTIDVELRYQTIAYRWAQNLERYKAPEPQRFVAYYRDSSAESSVVVASVTVPVLSANAAACCGAVLSARRAEPGSLSLSVKR